MEELQGVHYSYTTCLSCCYFLVKTCQSIQDESRTEISPERERVKPLRFAFSCTLIALKKYTKQFSHDLRFVILTLKAGFHNFILLSFLMDEIMA